jgi:hypothetical protein
MKYEHTSFFFASSLSIIACFARLSAAAFRSSSNFAFCSSFVRAGISSVDSEKSVCSLLKIWYQRYAGYVCRFGGADVLEAWNSACAWLLNFFPHSLQTKDLATSPSKRLGGKSLRSSSPAVDLGALISSMDLS